MKLLTLREEQVLFHLLELNTARIYLSLFKAKALEPAECTMTGIIKQENRDKNLHRFKGELYSTHKGEYDTIDRIKRIICAKNLGLILKLMQKYYINVSNRRDIQQEGLFAILKCINKFEYRRGLRFSTYLTWWARQIIGKAAFEQTQLITIPLYVLNKSKGTGYQPSSKINYSKSIGEDSKYTIGEIFESSFSDFDDVYKESLNKRLIRIFLENYKPKYEYVLRAYWGVNCSCKSINELSSIIEVKKERIKQIIHHGYKKFKALLREFK